MLRFTTPAIGTDGAQNDYNRMHLAADYSPEPPQRLLCHASAESAFSVSCNDAAPKPVDFDRLCASQRQPPQQRRLSRPASQTPRINEPPSEPLRRLLSEVNARTAEQELWGVLRFTTPAIGTDGAQNDYNRLQWRSGPKCVKPQFNLGFRSEDPSEATGKAGALDKLRPGAFSRS